MSNGTLWVKKQLSEFLIFFQTLRIFERTFSVFGEKIFGRDIKIENCSLRLIKSNKKSNFWKISFFSFFLKSSELWTNIYRAWQKSFGQGHQNWKLYSMSSEYQFEHKNNFLKVLKVFICFGFGTWNFWMCCNRVFTRAV